MNPEGEQDLSPSPNALKCKCGFPTEPIQAWILHFGWCPRMMRMAVQSVKHWRSCA